MEEYKLFLDKYPEGKIFSRVHAILLTPDGRVLLRYKEGEPRVTGGRIDPGDTDLVDTLRREVREEINCEIDKCDYLGYLEYHTEDSCEYFARMVARISKILPPQPDPDTDNHWIYGRTLAPREIAAEELAPIPVFGENNIKVLDAAYKVAREKAYFTELPNQEYEVLNVESHD